MELKKIAEDIKNDQEKIILIYAFNSTGKTRLSVAYKDITKNGEQHTGIYYNAFSEDIFVWDNDIENDEQNIKLTIKPSSLNKFHSALNEKELYDKLKPFNPNYSFRFTHYEKEHSGEIESIDFYLLNDSTNNTGEKIKISRGEERIFIWCFFLALFENEDWSGECPDHFFIDDPVSSLDDHNIFITAAIIYDLLEKHYKRRKFIITTHHFGFFSILGNWLLQGSQKDKFKSKVKAYTLSNESNKLALVKNGDIFLFHLYLIRLLKEAETNGIQKYHLALLRQLLENIASFLGVGYFSYVLQHIGLKNPDQTADIINALSHQKVYQYQSEDVQSWEKDFFSEILKKIESKYNFKL